MKKKIITLLVLAVAAGGIAFFTRPKIDAVPKVTPEIEQQAVEQVRNYIEAVRKNDYRQLRAVSAFADRASAKQKRRRQCRQFSASPFLHCAHFLSLLKSQLLLTNFIIKSRFYRQVKGELNLY